VFSVRYSLLHPDVFPKISWTDRVKKEVLHRDKAERNSVQTVKRRKYNWIGHVWRVNYLLKHVIEGKA